MLHCFDEIVVLCSFLFTIGFILVILLWAFLFVKHLGICSRNERQYIMYFNTAAAGGGM